MAHRVLAIFRRRLFACLTILSFLLCLATIALWVRSYWRFDALNHANDVAETVQDFGTQSNFGGLCIVTYRVSSRVIKPQRGWRYATGRSSPDASLRAWEGPDSQIRSAWFFGFGYVSIDQTEAGYSLRAICFPHWFPALLFAILPAIRLRAILRTRRRNRIGLCPHCGYDLRATPQGGRCPECGAVAPTRQSSEWE